MRYCFNGLWVNSAFECMVRATIMERAIATPTPLWRGALPHTHTPLWRGPLPYTHTHTHIHTRIKGISYTWNKGWRQLLICYPSCFLPLAVSPFLSQSTLHLFVFFSFTLFSVVLSLLSMLLFHLSVSRRTRLMYVSALRPRCTTQLLHTHIHMHTQQHKYVSHL